MGHLGSILSNLLLRGDVKEHEVCLVISQPSSKKNLLQISLGFRCLANENSYVLVDYQLTHMRQAEYDRGISEGQCLGLGWKKNRTRTGEDNRSEK